MFVTKSVIPWYAHPDSQMPPTVGDTFHKMSLCQSTTGCDRVRQNSVCTHHSSRTLRPCTRISTCRGSASSFHRSPPSAPGGYSLNRLFKWIASCTAVVLTNKCFPSSSRNALHSDLRPLKEKSSPQRTNVTIRTRHAVFTSEGHSSRHLTWTFRYPTQTLKFPSDTPIKVITASTSQSNAAPASLSPYIAFSSL